MERTRLEPGLLPMFRAYVFVRALGLALVAMVKLPEIETVMTRDLLVTGGLYLAEALFLLGYLSSPKGIDRLGRWYLPIALFVAAVSPIIQMRYIFSIYHVGEALDFWLIFPFLAIPLIFTAWQYSFNAVLLYSTGTTLLEPAIAGVLALTRPVSQWYDGRMLMVRMLFLLAIGYVVSYLMTEQREQRRELAEANRKLIRFAEAQEQIATLRERNRLARELHDTLAHTLSGLTVQLDALASVWKPEDPRAARMLAHALENARTGLDGTRRTLQDLRAAPLEELGLAGAIRRLAEKTAEQADLALNLELSEEFKRLPMDVEQVFYRVAQEALQNVVKHASATSVTVELYRNGEGLTLVVRDDGRGFAPEQAEAPDRFGLRGMRERAALVGAQLTIEPLKEGGPSLVGGPQAGSGPSGDGGHQHNGGTEVRLWAPGVG